MKAVIPYFEPDNVVTFCKTAERKYNWTGLGTSGTWIRGGLGRGLNTMNPWRTLMMTHDLSRHLHRISIPLSHCKVSPGLRDFGACFWTGTDTLLTNWRLSQTRCRLPLSHMDWTSVTDAWGMITVYVFWPPCCVFLIHARTLFGMRQL